MRKFIVGSLAAAIALSVTASAVAQPPAPPAQCFVDQEWSGWKATPDSKVIYLRVGVNQVYRLDLSAACPMLQDPGAHLVNVQHGPDTICGPEDLQLSVADSPSGGVREPCIVSALTPLTSAQASALPKDLQP